MNKKQKIVLLGVTGGLLVASLGWNIGSLIRLGNLNDQINQIKENSPGSESNEAKEKFLDLYNQAFSKLLSGKFYENAFDLELTYQCDSVSHTFSDLTFMEAGKTDPTTQTFDSVHSTNIANKITIKKESDYVAFEICETSLDDETSYSVVSNSVVHERDINISTTKVSLIKNGDTFQQQYINTNSGTQNGIDKNPTASRTSYNFNDESAYISFYEVTVGALFEKITNYESVSTMVLNLYAKPACSISSDNEGKFESKCVMPDYSSSDSSLTLTGMLYSQEIKDKAFKTNLTYYEHKKNRLIDAVSSDELKYSANSISYEKDVSSFDSTSTLFNSIDDTFYNVCVCIGQ